MRAKTAIHGLVLAGALAILAAPLSAQSFGSALAVGEDRVIAGEPGGQAGPGRVYVYRRGADGWAEAARLQAADAERGDRFGRAIALDGERLLVGASAADDGRGAAYLFRLADGAWGEEARVQPRDLSEEAGFGTSVTLAGDLALVGAAGSDEAPGAVHVYRRGADGAWSRAATLSASDAAGGDDFGAAVALAGDALFVGAPGRSESDQPGAGAVYVFRRGTGGAWEEAGKLVARTPSRGAGFGSALVVGAEGRVHVGAPGAAAGAGIVHTFALDEEGDEWDEDGRLFPFATSRIARFGAALAAGADGGLWVGAPFNGGFEGRIYHYVAGDGEWATVETLEAPGAGRGDRLGDAITVGGDVLVATRAGKDYGAGTSLIYERAGDGWRMAAEVFGEVTGLDPITAGPVSCTEGEAALFACDRVDILSFLPVQALGGGRGVRVNDVWGWTDPRTGREYALVGMTDRTSFVDVTDPLNPVLVGTLPMHEGARGSTWRDIKVYEDHAFVVSDGAGEHGMQVFDLARLRDVAEPPVTFDETAHYDGIASAHNIVINPGSGFAYSVGSSGGGATCGGGLHMIDIREPTRPTFAGCFADERTGRVGTGYSHDAMCIEYDGPDAEHVGKEICFGANETALSIADVTDKESPAPLAVAAYPNVGYAHQGWITEDHRYFYLDDELDEIRAERSGQPMAGTRTMIWDIADLDDPVLVKEHYGTTFTSDHNLYIRGDYAYQSNYVSGLRILDVSDPENPEEVAFFDTVPWTESPGFDGSWSNYPFFESGTIVVTSGREGLFLLRHRTPELVP